MTQARLPVQHADPAGEEARRSEADSATARQLWESLYRARNDQAHQTQAHLKDAVFGFYLPRARAIAGRVATDGSDLASCDHAAELALAKAVLAWQRQDPEGFDRFLRASITAEFRNLRLRRRGSRRPASVAREPSGGPEVP